MTAVALILNILGDITYETNVYFILMVANCIYIYILMFVLPLNVLFCGNIHNNELIENDYVLIWAVIFLWFYFKL